MKKSTIFSILVVLTFLSITMERAYADTDSGFNILLIKDSLTILAFGLVFPQVISAYLLYKHKFLSKIKTIRTYHRGFGRFLIGIYIVVSILCLSGFGPALSIGYLFFPISIKIHSIFGFIGYVAIATKISFVRHKKGYKPRTLIVGGLLALIFIIQFITTII
ncbi:MAG: DUF6529 family protein [Methanosarcinales archaeon]